MGPVETPATVLTTFAYGETSRIARLATRELGVVSVIARGAGRPGNRFGASLRILSEGTATIVPARQGDLHTLTAFDLLRGHAALGSSMERYAVASLLGEMMLRCGSPSDAGTVYAFFRHAVDLVEMAPPETLGTLGLRAIWGLVARLGVAPALERCVRDGAPVAADAPAAFSIDLGGVLCGACARGVEITRLPREDRRDLTVLLHGGDELPLLDARHLAAHRRLVERYVRRHLAMDGVFPALEFWSDRPWMRYGA